MALQCLVIVSLFLVLVGTTMAYPGPSAEEHTIDYYPDEEVQFLGRYAVEVNSNKSKSHLIFQKVVNGTVLTLPNFSFKERIWNLELMAINCTESGSPSNYIVQLFENLYGEPSEYSNPIWAYDSSFSAAYYMGKIN